MRIWNLGLESLWLDELHTMVEADNKLSWTEFFGHLKLNSQHPPLHHLVTRLFFTLLGHSAFSARLVSVCIGTLSLFAMYLLGKEVSGKRLGIILLVITTFNYYNIYYSREARDYIFLFVFATLSLTFFIRLLKQQDKTTIWFYALSTLCMLYSHYYSLFTFLGQFGLSLFFIFSASGKKQKQLFLAFMWSGIIIAIGYSFWLPFLFSISGIGSFWIQKVEPNFLVNYFLEYFGGENILTPLISLLLLTYLINLLTKTKKDQTDKITEDPSKLTFIIGLVWVSTTILIPYIRSEILFPQMISRYTIGALPIIILFIGMGISQIQSKVIQSLILLLFIILSLTDLIVVKRFYTAITKTQFREATNFIASNNDEHYPIINELTYFQNQYYMNYFNLENTVLNGDKEQIISSFLDSLSDKRSNIGFWLFRAHGDNDIEKQVKTRLEENYSVTKEADFLDATVTLYTSNKYSNTNYTRITYKDFQENESSSVIDNNVIAIWTKSITSKAIPLKEGNYNLQLIAKGTEVDNEFSNLSIYANNNLINELETTSQYETYKFQLYLPLDTNIKFKIILNNDLATEKKDRNAFVKEIFLKKIR